jgi:hypothetical protein
LTGETASSVDARIPSQAGGAENLRSRRRRRKGFFVALVALLVGGPAVVWPITRPGPERQAGPVAQRELARLTDFQTWLQTNHAKGYIGEVGWPGGEDAARWNAVASAWYDAADRDRLWVSAWAAGQWWPAGYPMAVYRFSGGGPSASVRAGRQASVVETHARPVGALRGVDLAGGAFGTAEDGNQRYSNASPGVYGADYYYDSYPNYRYVASRGLAIVRISFTWERLQPRLGQPLDPVALAHLEATVRDAARAGLGVVLDLHNYGGYWFSNGETGRHRLALGSSQLPAAALAEVWRRLAVAFRDVPGVLGFGLMNEPRSLAAEAAVGARVWEAASQSAVDAIRAVGDRRMVSVAAYGGSAPEQFARFHPHAWIRDPAQAVRYEAHQYFDSDGSGRSRSGLAAAVTPASE